MSVLVTGATGFIGANLARRLVALGARVHVLVRPSSPMRRLEDVASRLIVCRADVTDRRLLDQVTRAVSPEVIFHLAARGASRHGVDAAELFAANVLGTVNMLAASAPLSYRRFVHMGGSSEYGPRPGPMRETDRLDPITPYGASKAAATLACRQFACAHERPVVVLRPFSVYGPWESRSRLVPTAIAAAFEGRELPLTPPGYRRDLVFVDDVVEACVLAATREVAAGEIVNVGSGREWSNEEIVGEVERAAGCHIRCRPGEYAPRLSDTAHWVADISRAERVLGWKPRRTLRQGLEETVSWWRAPGTRSTSDG